MSELNTQDDILDLRTVFSFFKSKWKPIIITGFLGLIIGFLLYPFMPYKHETSVPVYISQADPNTIQKPSLVVDEINKILSDVELFNIFLTELENNSPAIKKEFSTNPKLRILIVSEQTSYLNSPGFLVKSLKEGRGMKLIGKFPFEGPGKEFFDASIKALNKVITLHNSKAINNIDVVNLEKLKGVKSKFIEFRERSYKETFSSIKKLNSYADEVFEISRNIQKQLLNKKSKEDLVAIVRSQPTSVSLGVFSETTDKKNQTLRIIYKTKEAASFSTSKIAPKILERLNQLETDISMLNFDLEPVFSTMEKLQQNLIQSSNDYYSPPEKTSILIPEIVLNKLAAEHLKENKIYDRKPLSQTIFSFVSFLLLASIACAIYVSLSVLNSIK